MVSSELTDEIRGERLRFVDAMKEATEINVQGIWKFSSLAMITMLTIY